MSDEPEVAVAVEQAPAEAPAEEETKKVAEIPIEKRKPVPKPDDAALRNQIAEEEEKIVTLQKRLGEIKETLDKRESGRHESPELQAAKARLNEVKQQSRRLAQEKRAIFDEISAADEMKQQQLDLTQRLKSQMTVSSLEAIENKVRDLEHMQQTTSLSVKEEKKILEEIKKLNANKPMIKSLHEAKESLEKVMAHCGTLYARRKEKQIELDEVNKEQETHRAHVDEAKAKDESKRADIPSLYKERDELRKEMKTRKDSMRKLRDDFNDKLKEWRDYQKAVRDAKQKEYNEYKAAKEAEYQAAKKAYEEEQAKRDPWEEEKLICDQLIEYCAKYVPKKETAKAVGDESASELPSGFVMKKKASLDDDDMYGNAVGKKKGKKKPAAVEAPKAVKLTHNPADFALWEKLGFSAPASSKDCVALHEQLLEKKEWLKTAPPKAKKPKEEPKPEVKEVAADAEPEFDMAKAKAEEAAELKIKQEKERIKAEEAAKAEADRIAKMHELEGQGKKVSGGMHKFDASEVDVHGGDATADDFMDAFGFGGDPGEGGGDEEEVAAEPEFDMAKAKAEEAAELKIKQEKERIKAEEAAKAEADRIAKMHELEGQGKKVSGGMHKFDASEVDVHGGDATADDFMDAFGFGGDEGGDAANVGDDPIVTVEATSGSSVNVTLKM